MGLKVVRLWLNQKFEALSNKLAREKAKDPWDQKDISHLLDIPLVGGSLYIIGRIIQALQFKSKMKLNNKDDLIKSVIKEEFRYTNAIRRQLEEYQLTGGVVEIHVKPNHQVYLREVLREFSNITCTDIGGGNYILTCNEDI